uniref:T-box domain-containing protein n=1 Tax=Denticeps clupeoides TaxID=299321 RepID=A0AAY4BUN6_9TELE
SIQHAELLPPERTCKGISVTLDNNNMWNEFFRCTTEMILTKQGRRMFPYCRFRLSGMEPFQNYMLVMDITPMDNFRYKWTDRHWEPNGKAERHIPGRMFVHPDSPSSGHRWMQNPISFYKLKLTNNPLDQEGHIILHSMQRYLPRLHVVPADMLTDMSQLDGPDVVTFSFPQTEFFAVTAYQNLSITQLKIDYNPFAKGFREDATNLRTLSSVERGLQALFAKKGGFDVKPPGCDTHTHTQKKNCASKTQSLEPYAASSETCVASSHLSTADINSPPTCTELSLKARSDSSTLQPNSTVNLSTNSAPFSPCTFPDSEILRTNHPDVLSQSTSFHDLSIRSPSPLSDAEPLEPIGINLDAPVSNEGDERAPQSRCQQRPGSQSGGSKRSMKCKKRRKTDRHDELQAVGGLTDVKMQPNLEDVEGQLFVSFTSKVK